MTILAKVVKKVAVTSNEYNRVLVNGENIRFLQGIDDVRTFVSNKPSLFELADNINITVERRAAVDSIAVEVPDNHVFIIPGNNSHISVANMPVTIYLDENKLDIRSVSYFIGGPLALDSNICVKMRNGDYFGWSIPTFIEEVGFEDANVRLCESNTRAIMREQFPGLRNTADGALKNFITLLSADPEKSTTH